LLHHKQSAKLIYPFANGWSLFGKLGAAVVHQDVYNQVYLGETPIVDTNKTRVAPLVGAGISFNFTPRLAAELYYEYVASPAPISEIYASGLGLSYTF
jgi:opacity protein-like surface antigen